MPFSTVPEGLISEHAGNTAEVDTVLVNRAAKNKGIGADSILQPEQICKIYGRCRTEDFSPGGRESSRLWLPTSLAFQGTVLRGSGFCLASRGALTKLS